MAETEQVFKPESKTLKEIFGDANSFYKMPEYQRAYSWNDEQIEQLWDDIYSAYLNHKENAKIDSNYFLGSIILIPVDKAFDVVDGQQRLTTLTILFCVINSLRPKIGNIKIIQNSVISVVESKERLKLETSLQMQNEFNEQIVKEIIWPAEFSKKDKKDKKYMNAAIIFKEKIDSIKDDKDLDAFVSYLFEKVSIIKIVCSSEPFAIKLFQVLNTRGLDLSPADLIKTFLLGKLDVSNRPQFMASWNQIETTCKMIGEDIASILSYYEYFRLGDNPKRTLYEELQDIFEEDLKKKGTTANTIIFEIKTFVDNYNVLMNKCNRDIYAMRYLKHQIYWRSILMTASQVGYVEYDKLTASIRNYYYLYWIAGYTATKIKQTSFNAIKWIKEGKAIKDIQAELDNKIIGDNVINRAKQNLKGDVYSEDWTKPLLILLEYYLVDNTNLTDYLKLDNKIQLEHILPQKYTEYKYWLTCYSKEQADILVNKLQNLTLLSGTKNISARNYPFNNDLTDNKATNDKLFVYKGKGIDGITGFRITQHIVDNYKTWDKADVDNREKWLSAEIKKIFGVEIFVTGDNPIISPEVSVSSDVQATAVVQNSKKVLNGEFFEGFYNKLIERFKKENPGITLSSGTKDSYLKLPIGHGSKVHFEWKYAKRPTLHFKVCLDLENNEHEKNYKILSEIEKHKEELRKSIGENIDYNCKWGETWCRLSVINSKVFDEPKLEDWIIDITGKFYRYLKPIVDEVMSGEGTVETDK